MGRMADVRPVRIGDDVAANTKEGPAHAVEEMTERRLVVLQS